MKSGSVAIVLTAHMPYVRAAGRSFAGEEALHELIAYALVPTLTTLYDLREQGMKPHVALAYSPLVLEQLADPVVQKHFCFWIDAWLEQLDRTLQSFELAGDTQRIYLARFYREWGKGIRHSFTERFGRNLVAALRQLSEEGLIEPLSSAATAPHLGLIAREETLRVQLEAGAMAVARRLGRRPQGFWPPNLEFRSDASAPLLATGASYAILRPRENTASTQPEPFWLVANRLAALPCDMSTEPYLRNPELDYASDPLYLSPIRDTDGFAWNRNGLSRADEAYDPYDAFQRAQEHAGHFAHVLAAARSPELRIIPIDADLAGLRWFEGATWLRALLTELCSHETLALTTPSAHLRNVRPHAGARGWPSVEGTYGHEALQQALHSAETRVSELANRLPELQGDQERAMHQAARELLLAQSGEHTPAEQNAHHEPRRAMHHLARCMQLCDFAEREALSEAEITVLETLEEEDNSFTHLNYRIFAA